MGNTAAVKPATDHSPQSEHKSSPAVGKVAHHPKAKAPAKKKAKLNLAEEITIDKIAGVIRDIADRHGEKGELKFEVEVSAVALGLFGPVSGIMEGLAELVIGCELTDNNMVALYVEVGAAIRAGFHVGKPAAVEAGNHEHSTGKGKKAEASLTLNAGYEGDIVNPWLADSHAAAAWIHAQLKSLNAYVKKHTKQSPFKFPDDDVAHKKSHGKAKKKAMPGHLYSLTDRRKEIGVTGEGEIGNLSGSATYTEAIVSRKFKDKQRNRVFEGSEHHREVEVALQFESGGKELSGHYHRDWSNTVSSPLYYTNGIFIEHTLSFGISGHDVFKKLAGKINLGATKKTVQAAVMAAFLRLQTMSFGFPHMQALTGKVFEQIVSQMMQFHTKQHVGFDVIFNWNQFGEADGTNELMYFRVKVEPKISAGLHGKVLGSGIEAEASVSTQQVVFESIGTQTVSYIQRQFIYESAERPWSMFKAMHRGKIRQLAVNCATPGFHYYTPSVEAAYHRGDGQDADAAVAALEDHWRRQARLVETIMPDISEVARLLDEATSWLSWSRTTQYQYMDMILGIVGKYKHDPRMIAYFIEQLPAFGMDIDSLNELAEDTGLDGQFDQLRAIAAKGASLELPE